MAKQKDESHSEGILLNEFCVQRTKTCQPCKNTYTKCVTSDTDLAVSFKFPRLAEKETGTEKQDISQNAHHILCVAEVTKLMSKDKKIKAVMENTKWCVNAELNMMALPLFAHTVYWYLKFTGAGKRKKIGEYTSAGEPPFKDLPNHDIDHGHYNKEVWTDLNRIKGRVKQAAHKLKPAKLVEELNNASKHFRQQLKDRGIRGKKTHGNWVEACKGDKGDKATVKKWYMPFSMSKTPAKRAFPAKVQRNLSRLEKAINFVLGR